METTLPTLLWHPTAASSPRFGHLVSLVVVHRWGVRYTSEADEARSYLGVVNFFSDPRNKASAHVVYPGSAVPKAATQMVAWADMAWAEAAYNPTADDVESADAIWLGHDPIGFDQLALIVSQRLKARGLPPVWSSRSGFCRHADLGAAGGGHTECPTTDLALWRSFVGKVQTHYHASLSVPSHWGR